MSLTKRQIEIMDCATTLIAEAGIQNLTTRSLAEKVGISEPGLYRHFKNKTDIIEKILKSFEEETKESMATIINSRNSAIDKLQFIFLSRCIFFTNNQNFSAIIFSEEIFRDKNELTDKVKSIMHVHRENILNVIINGQKSDEIRNDIKAEHICNLFIGVLRLLVTKWRMSGFSFSLTTEGLDNFESLKKMIVR